MQTHLEPEDAELAALTSTALSMLPAMSDEVFKIGADT